MSTITQRLSIKEKVGYSLGDMASNLYFQTFVIFMPMFYTDVFGLSASAMGFMMLFSRIWDAANDPIMGIVADRTQTRWGKYRPYIASFAIPIAIAGYVAFTTPDLGETGKLIYAYVTYTILMMMYTAVNVPYAALMGVLSPNSEERASASQFRFVAAFIGQVVVGAFTITLVKELGAGDEATGWKLTMAIYGAIAAALLFATFYFTKERVSPTKEKRNRISEDLKDLVQNKPWLLIGLATFFQLSFIVMRGSSTTFYFKYFVEVQNFELLGYNLDLTSFFITIGTVATLFGALTTKFFSNLISKKNVYSWFLTLSAVFSLLFYFLGPKDIGLMLLFNVLVSFFFGAVSVTQWAIYTDTADFGEWKFNRRATALIMAASLFSLKMGLTIGGSSVGWILDAYGFVANVAQSAESLLGIKLLMSIYPAIFGIIGGALMFFYPLDDEMMVQIEEDLQAREAAAEAPEN